MARLRAPGRPSLPGAGLCRHRNQPRAGRRHRSGAAQRRRASPRPCKRWRARKVGVEIVRELYGVMTARGAVGGYVVSAGEFSEEAKGFAAGRNIDLWNGARLKAVTRGVKEHLPAPAPITHLPQPAATVPVCPNCGAAMVRRTAKRGANNGQAFWGCPHFPNCRGTRPITAPGV